MDDGGSVEIAADLRAMNRGICALMPGFRGLAPVEKAPSPCAGSEVAGTLTSEATMAELSVKRLMQHPVVELDPDADVAFALEAARIAHTHYFPLLRGGSLIGIVCTCDLDDAPREQRISALAHADVLTVQSSAPLSEVAQRMRERVVGSAVVLEGDAVRGLLTREALVQASSEWAAYFADQHCEACGALKHLRRSETCGLLCCSCASRAKDPDWQETGGGD
jgi:CBS domain-containing protein